MARSRMIKPDFSDDEKIAEVSFMARLVYILLWPQSDDYGVVKGNPRWLKTRLFPYDDSLTLVQFSEWLGELERLERLIKFTHNNEPYYYMPKFLVHQRIEKPSKTRNPEPPQSVLSRVGEQSESGCLPVSEDSPNSRQPVGDEVEEEKEVEVEPEGELSSNNGSTTGENSELTSTADAVALSLARNQNKQTGDETGEQTSPLRNGNGRHKLQGYDVEEQPLRVLEISKFVTRKYPNATIRQRETLAGRIEKLARTRKHDLTPEEAERFGEIVLAQAPTFWQAQAFVTVLEQPCEDEQVYNVVKAARNGTKLGPVFSTG